MKIKSLVVITVISIAVLCFGFAVNAQTTNVQALIAQLQAQIAQLTAQLQTLLAQQKSGQSSSSTSNSSTTVPIPSSASAASSLSFGGTVRVYMSQTPSNILALYKPYGPHKANLVLVGTSDQLPGFSITAQVSFDSLINETWQINNISYSGNIPNNFTKPTVLADSTGTFAQKNVSAEYVAVKGGGDNYIMNWKITGSASAGVRTVVLPRISSKPFIGNKSGLIFKVRDYPVYDSSDPFPNLDKIGNFSNAINKLSNGLANMSYQVKDSHFPYSTNVLSCSLNDDGTLQSFLNGIGINSSNYKSYYDWFLLGAYKTTAQKFSCDEFYPMGFANSPDCLECGPGAKIGWSANFNVGGETIPFLAFHEFGHGIGLSDEYLNLNYYCGNTDRNNVTYNEIFLPCEKLAGQFYMTMGSSLNNFWYDPMERAQLGWLSSSQVNLITKSGIYDLYSDNDDLTSDSTKPLILEIPVKSPANFTYNNGLAIPDFTSTFDDFVYLVAPNQQMVESGAAFDSVKDYAKMGITLSGGAGHIRQGISKAAIDQYYYSYNNNDAGGSGVGLNAIPLGGEIHLNWAGTDVKIKLLSRSGNHATVQINFPSASCTPNWQCGNWSACTNGQQTRTCTDSNSCGTTAGQPPITQPCSTASITVTSPVSGDTWQQGSIHNITWQSAGLSNVVVYLDDNSIGKEYILASNVPASAGSYAWTVPSGSVLGGLPFSSGKMFKIKVGYGSTMSYSSGYFIISSIPIQPSITVTSPNGGEAWKIGETHNITWNVSNVTNSSLSIQVKDTSGNVVYQKYSTPSAGSYSWIIPSTILAGQYKIYLSTYSDSSNTTLVQDSSDNYFSVAPNYDACRLDKLDGTNITRSAIYDQASCLSKLCDIYGPANLSQTSSKCIFNGAEIKRYTQAVQSSITVTSPNGGETWIQGQTYNITWSISNVTNLALSIQVKNSSGNVAYSKYNVSPSAGSFSWTVPSTVSAGQYKIYLGTYSDATNATLVQDSSDNYFSIAVPATPTCTDSDGGINYNIKGYVSTNYNGQDINVKIYDLCMMPDPQNSSQQIGVSSCSGSNNCQVEDFYCNGNAGPYASISSCLNGCSDGACISPTSYNTQNVAENQLASIADAIANLIAQIKLILQK